MTAAAHITDDDILLLDRRGARTADFLGVAFTLADSEALIRRLTEEADARRPFRYVVTPNVDNVVKAHREAETYGPLYRDAWLAACDSRIVQLLARWSGLDIPVTPGSELTERLFADVIAPDEPVTVIGGDADVIAALRARYGLTELRWHDPPMGLRHKPEAISEAAAFIAAQGARFVFLAIGNPQQVMVAHAVQARGDATGVGLCIGASLDFLAGKVARAPRWMQEARLEWLFRLASEPKRLWRRYLVEGPEVFLIWRRWLRSRAAGA
jgi:N-acetylglucosaminyldiphosphoundecaprenol N-acetyl-beta-D-mannosaminyltransferase